MRPTWKGNITFGLVNVPVILYPAEKSKATKFKLVDKRDKAPIHYLRINERTGKEVPWNDVAKGFEYEKGEFLVVDENELKKIAPESTKNIGIESFIKVKDLDYVDFEKPYYLVPDKKGEKGYVILREVLKKTNTVGIAKVVIHTREYLAAIMPYEEALIVDLLRYHDEIRAPEEFELPTDSLKKYRITAKEMEIAKQLVDSMTTHWRPEDYHDEFQSALEEWIDAKAKHKKPAAHKAAPAQSAKVINFVDLLKKSLDEKKSKKTRSAHHAHKKTGTSH